MSAQCLYCQSVRAKNTSRQRAHLLECSHYLDAMKAHNPESPILHEAINGTPLAATPTPASKVPKKRDLDTMVNGFQGDSTSINRTWPIPKPTLERDFQMSVQLNPKISVGHGIWGQRNWISYISGHWNGRWGKGTVVVSDSFFQRKNRPSMRLSQLTQYFDMIAWRSRLSARRSRSIHPHRCQLLASDSRPSCRLHLGENRWLARGTERYFGEARGCRSGGRG